MAVLVTARGLAPDDAAPQDWLALARLLDGVAPDAGQRGVDVPPDTDPAVLAPFLGQIAALRIGFPAMGDGRGFSLARALRGMGYAGRLRAAGPLIPDQMDALLRVGFDEVELPDALAARHPATAWDRRRASYQSRLSA